MPRYKLPEEWVEKARVFVEDAERHIEAGHYWLACFEAQQAAELYLKALITAVAGVHPFTHDLVELLEALRDLGFNVPEELYVYADALTPHYTLARYPGRKPVTYNKGLAKRCVRYARILIEWVESQAAQSDGGETKETG
ncbi:HEPN domain protein [Pyrolobus fumarii 1A]|uniref:HEPN domain protein n=1 Tax=Pyrolobus fumarii (strain DSM 11204 / 1A) TaxID=694429 RepID=G0EDG1_PYRF1|nr:HEPN domain-containing protein [Pyrolobus fumarii]AEM38646.1 HEPN domain protein [Pyrolobus fumarii 1A]